jgi:hypothetical protein
MMRRDEKRFISRLWKTSRTSLFLLKKMQPGNAIQRALQCIIPRRQANANKPFSPGPKPAPGATSTCASCNNNWANCCELNAGGTASHRKRCPAFRVPASAAPPGGVTHARGADDRPIPVALNAQWEGERRDCRILNRAKHGAVAVGMQFLNALIIEALPTAKPKRQPAILKVFEKVYVSTPHAFASG